MLETQDHLYQFLKHYESLKEEVMKREHSNIARTLESLYFSLAHAPFPPQIRL